MICLIRPPALDVLRFASTSISLPLGLAYIAGALEKDGHNIKIIDAVGLGPRTSTRCYKGYLVGLRIEEIVSLIPQETKIIGISAIFTHEWPVISALTKLIKAKFPNTPILIGGEHITSLPEFSLITSEADFIVMGEGEESCIELIRAIITSQSFNAIKGIGFKQNKRIVINPRRNRNITIDEIAPPAWQYFDLKTYTEQGFLGGMDTNALTIPILATRGCPYQCTYCSSPNMWTTRWIARSPLCVVKEIETWIEKYNARNFPFQDLTAIINREWIIEFCDLLIEKKLNISWQLPSGTRSEAIDDEVAKKLYQSGMVTMSYAPESGAEETRKLVKKRVTEEGLFESIRCAVNNNLNVSAFFVLGFPHDQIIDFKNTANFVRKIAKLGIEDIAIAFYMALPGTELFRLLSRQGKIKLDRNYFRHILDSQKLIPSIIYSYSFNRWQLLFWKIRIFIEFYGAKSNHGLALGLLGSIFSGAKGFFGRKHQSKLQTVFRNFFENLIRQLQACTKSRWMSHEEEILLFAKWDEIYKNIEIWKEENLNALNIPSSFEELAKSNYMKALKDEHIQIKEIETCKLVS